MLSDNSSRHIEVNQHSEEAKGKKSKGEKPQQPSDKPKRQRRATPKFKSIEEIPCPKCGTGHLLKGRTAYGCSNFRSGCDLRLPFEQYPETLTPQQLYKAINKKK